MHWCLIQIITICLSALALTEDYMSSKNYTYSLFLHSFTYLRLLEISFNNDTSVYCITSAVALKKEKQTKYFVQIQLYEAYYEHWQLFIYSVLCMFTTMFCALVYYVCILTIFGYLIFAYS